MENKQDILVLKFKSQDLGKQVSIREFFYLLMKELWIEKEEFSGKRPFGNSCWDSDLIKCLITNKLIKGKIDSYGYIEDYDINKADKYILKEIIRPLFGIK